MLIDEAVFCSIIRGSTAVIADDNSLLRQIGKERFRHKCHRDALDLRQKRPAFALGFQHFIRLGIVAVLRDAVTEAALLIAHQFQELAAGIVQQHIEGLIAAGNIRCRNDEIDGLPCLHRDCHFFGRFEENALQEIARAVIALHRQLAHRVNEADIQLGINAGCITVDNILLLLLIDRIGLIQRERYRIEEIRLKQILRNNLKFHVVIAEIAAHTGIIDRCRADIDIIRRIAQTVILAFHEHIVAVFKCHIRGNLFAGPVMRLRCDLAFREQLELCFQAEIDRTLTRRAVEFHHKEAFFSGRDIELHGLGAVAVILLKHLPFRRENAQHDIRYIRGTEDIFHIRFRLDAVDRKAILLRDADAV